MTKSKHHSKDKNTHDLKVTGNYFILFFHHLPYHRCGEDQTIPIAAEVEKYLSGKEILLQWFLGQVARATRGKTNPNVTKELLTKTLEEKR